MAKKASKNTIKLKLYQNIINEYRAGGVITPGMLIKVGTDNKVVAHAVSGGVCEKMFALEDELQGRTIYDNFASGEPVQTCIATTGSEVLAIIADGSDIAIGDLLASNGDGKLKEVAGTNHAIAVALEVKDMTGSAGADPSPYIKVRIL